MKKAITNLLFCAIIFMFNNSWAQDEKRQSATLAVDTSFLLPVNGVLQYLEIKGVSREKPVLLFIHGGPSWPATPQNRKYNQDLINDFIFVSWDQRNCGKSRSDTTVTLTPELYVEDAHLVTQFLKRTFRKKKIFVIGHSWGSIIGVALVQKYPTDYAAYISIGQTVNPGKSEMLARNYVMQQASLQNDTVTLNALATIPFSEEEGYTNGLDDLFKFWEFSDKYFIRKEVVPLENPMQLYSDYGALDWMTPAMHTSKLLFSYVNGGKTNLFNYNQFKLPVYFFVGKYDYITSAELAVQYFEMIKAPKKKLFLFERSGHAPNWQEPILFHKRLVQIAEENKTS
jgi:pimeloyl-ACP methyl ester carboxylesterase